MVPSRSYLAGMGIRLLVACWCAAAFLAGSERARALDTNAILNGWFAAQTNLHSWSATFVETRSFKSLTQPLSSTGHVWVAMPDRFRWELGTPAQTIAVRRGGELVLVYPRLKRAERYPLDGAQAGPWKEALALMQAGMPRSRAELESNFSLGSVVETNSAIEIALHPKSAMARKFMPEIRVTLVTNDYSLHVNQVTFSDGSSLRDEFSHAELNRPMDDSLFTPTIDPDFKVMNVPAK